MAYHPKAQCWKIDREETDSERMVRLYLGKIENFTGSGRRNKKLLSMAEKEIASNPSCLGINIAEVYYNGAPGIAINLDKTIEYYVVMIELDDFPSMCARPVGVLGNVLEVHELCSFSILPGLADRLEKAGISRRHSREGTLLVGLSKIFRGRFLDMSSEGIRAIEAYTDACAVLQSDSCSEYLRIHCNERIDVLSCVLDAAGKGGDVSDEISKIKNKSSKLKKEIWRASGASELHTTPARDPGTTIRLSFEIPEDVDEAEYAQKIRGDIDQFKKKKNNHGENKMKDNLRKERANQLRPRLQSALEMARSGQFSAWLYEELESCVLSSETFYDLYDFRELLVEAKGYLSNKELVMKRKKYRQIQEPVYLDVQIQEMEQVEPEPPSEFSRKNKRKIKKEQAKKEKLKAIQNASDVRERQEREKLQDDLPQLFTTRDDYETNYIIKEAQEPLPTQKPDIPPVALKMKSAQAEPEFEKRSFNLAVEMSLAECEQ